MAYSTPDGQRNGSRRYTGRAGESRVSSSGPVTSSGTRRVQARGGSSSQYRNSKNRRARGRDGYRLHSGNARLGRRGGLVNQILGDPKLLVVTLLGLALAVALIFGLLTLVRGCVNNRQQQKAAEEDADTRVSMTISSDMAEQFTAVLDRNDLFAQIAQNADAVGDTRLLELALAEPTAIEYVSGYLQGGQKGAQAYGDSVSKGYYPKLYNWDTRWGYVTYGDGPMGITGSGPTCLAMAYMGLSGKTDQTPDSLAKKATAGEGVDAVYDTKPEFFSTVAEELGLELTEYSPASENLSDTIESGTVLLIQLRERSLTDKAHWALAVSKNLDGSINLYDPTSTAVTEHPWDPNTIAAGSDAFYALSLAPVESEE